MASALTFTLLCALIVSALGAEKKIKRSEKLAESFKMEWEVDFLTNVIQIQASAKTVGYVGLGLSTNGGMTGADILIGGAFPNGSTYFADYHGVGKTDPILDKEQTWILVEAKEETVKGQVWTTIRFKRTLNTCDTEDIAISNDTLYAIWAFGETDVIKYHSKTNRGAKALNLLDPPNPMVDKSEFQVWEITVNTTIPSGVDTSYWCTVHKAPPLNKSHIVGFEVQLDSDLAEKYTHHLVLHRCVPKADYDLDSLMEPHLYPQFSGSECYKDQRYQSLNLYCGTYFYVWAKGGGPLFIPEHVGFPIGGKDAANEYFILEIHYDNPEKTPNVQYETGVNVYYTEHLRANDGGLLFIGIDPGLSLVIPPNRKDYIVAGHCNSACTNATFPEGGIKVFNVLLHAHLCGRQLKLRHFRDSKELPWISYDNNYDFNYQQNRALREEIQIKKGDHLTFECSYDTAWKADGTVTTGGYSTRDEMCEAFLLYYPQVKALDMCISLPYPEEDTHSILGLNVSRPDYKVQEPETSIGKSYLSALNSDVDWNECRVSILQNRTRFGHHFQVCRSYHSIDNNAPDIEPFATYPDITIPYLPLETCKTPHSTKAQALVKDPCNSSSRLSAHFIAIIATTAAASVILEFM